jgi:hypothetical protein
MANSIGTWLNIKQSPKGRIVTGSVNTLNKVEWRNGQQFPLPQEKWKYKFGLALPKNDPDTIQILNAIYNHVWATYSANEIAVRNGVLTAIEKGLQKRSGFSWKIYDGDAPNERTGQKPKFCEGCYIFPFELPEFMKGQPAKFKTYRWDNQPIDPSEIKLGYDVDMAFSVIDNGLLVSVPGGASAGIYLNAQFIRYLGTGEEIVFGPSIDQVMVPAKAPPMKGFGAAPAGNGLAGTVAQNTVQGFSGTLSVSTTVTPTVSMSAMPAPTPQGFPATRVEPHQPIQTNPMVGHAQADFPMMSGTNPSPAGFPDAQASAVSAPAQGPVFPNGDSASATVYRSSSVPGFDQPAA